MLEILACPECRLSPLEAGPEFATCSGCQARFPVLRDVIDCREVERDLTACHDTDEDNRVAQMLSDLFDETSSFNELKRVLEGIRARLAAGASLSAIDPRQVLREDAIGHEPFSAADAAHGNAILEKIPLYLEESGLPALSRGVALEDGAGLGYYVDGFSRHFEHLYVVDISKAQLILARKIMQERGLSNVTLVCASAEHLPFRDEAFDFIHSNNVIEHVTRQDALLSEARRVLKSGGLMFLMSPNRYSLYYEPHFHLPGFGFWPKFISRPWVKRYRRQNIEDIGLRSLGELMTLARASFGDHIKTGFIPRSLKDTATGGGLRGAMTAALRAPIIGPAIDFLVNKAALGLMPYHVLLCTKPAEPHRP